MDVGRAYGEDLAYIHDVGFTDFATQSAPGVLGLLAGAGITSGLVIDLGCGGGVWARTLVDQGYEVLGIDLSPEMIAIARHRVPEAQFVIESFLDMEFPPCLAVTSLGEVLSYLFDDRVDTPSLQTLFERIFRALRPGGLLVFDVCGPDRSACAPRKYVEGRDWAVSTTYDSDSVSRILTREITTYRRIGDCVQVGREVHRLRLYDADDLTQVLIRAGFTVETAPSYGTYRLFAGDTAFVAKKRCESRET